MTPTDILIVLDRPLADLATDRSTALDEAIRKVLRAAENESENAVCAFNSAI